MASPLGRLRYLYVGSADVARDLAYYRDVLGGHVAWDFEDFGTRVAAVELGDGPWILLAGHRKAPSILPIFLVDDLKQAAKPLTSRGWKPSEGPVEVPDGPCYLFHDPSGNELAILGNIRPDALVGAYAEANNRHAVHD